MTIGYHTLPFSKTLDVKQTYHNMINKGLYQKYQEYINQKADVLVIDDEVAKGVNLSYYNDEKSFEVHKIKAGLIYHSEISIHTDVRVYVKKTSF